jgi:hypothetical protein
MNDNTELIEKCANALIKAFAASSPRTVINKGYVSKYADNLIEGVSPASFEEDLRNGAGNELAGKFCAVRSSSALVVNCFAPFTDENKRTDLQLPWGVDFDASAFEKKIPHGVRGTVPHIDVFLEGANQVVAIESKCLEYLETKPAEFSTEYDSQIKDARRNTTWFRMMKQLMQKPSYYKFLNAAQLIKHAFGLMHSFDNGPCKLVYLFWEPSNWTSYSVFAEHRSEIERFSASTLGTSIEFVWMSYPELWDYWEKSSTVGWLADHVKRLRARYNVAV